MDIRAVAPAAPAPSASTAQPAARVPGQAVPGTVDRKVAHDESRAVTSAAPSGAPQAPAPVKLRAELKYDETLHRVVGRIVDETTGKEIREIPLEELRTLYAKTREMLGPLVDETV